MSVIQLEDTLASLGAAKAISESEYSSTATFQDVWSITGQNAITGTFQVFNESDVVGLKSEV